MRYLVVVGMLLAGCATQQQVGETTDAYVGRQVEEVNLKWKALDAVVTQAQADGLDTWDADADTLSYIKLLCNVALVGTVVAPNNPAPTVVAEIDWALVPVHIANACKIAMKVAAPVQVPEVVESPAPSVTLVPDAKP